jgi:hypothetical protein
MTRHRQQLIAVSLAVLVSSSAFAQSIPFKYRVYSQGLRAAAGELPPAPGELPPAEVEPDPVFPPSAPDPYFSQLRSLMHMDTFSGAGPLDLKGLAWTAQNVSVTAGGMYGTRALAFTQANSWAEGPVVDFQGGEYTIEAWVKPSSSTGLQPIVARWGDLTSQRVFLLALDNGVPRFRWGSGVNISGGVAPVGAWTHIAAMNRGSGYYIFVNGAQVANYGVTGAFPSSTVRTSLGNTFSSAGTMGGAGMSSYQGLMDEVRITRAARYPFGGFSVPDRPYSDQ